MGRPAHLDEAIDHPRRTPSGDPDSFEDHKFEANESFKVQDVSIEETWRLDISYPKGH